MYANLSPSFSVSHPRFPPFSAARRRAAPVKAVSVSTLAAESATARKINSLYEILRVKRTASLNEIKTAYRSLAKLYHPDAVIRQHHDDASDGKDFIQIHNAYETLSDPQARATYDLRLAVAIGSDWSRRMSSTSGYYPTRRWETDQCW